MSFTFRLKQSILGIDRILLAALLLCFCLSLYGITVKYNNPDQMAFLPLFLEGKLPFNPGWFDKPPFHTYFNYFLSVLPISVLSKAFDFSPQTEEILQTVWSRLLTKFLLLIAVGLLYHIARKSYGVISARVIALIAATTAGFIAYSHFLTVDIPVMFWMLVAFAFSHSLMLERKLSSYMLAGFFTGIAAATKYNGVAIGFSIVVAHVLSFKIGSWRSISWKEIFFHKGLWAGLMMVVVGFLAGNPFALLDYPVFSSGFLYNYMVAPVYEGQTGHSFIRFFGRMIEIIGAPFFVVSAIAFLFGLAAVFLRKEEWKRRATFLLCLSVLIPYYIEFGLFPRLETRFVLPIMPLWFLISGLLWEKLQPYKFSFGLLLFSLVGYNLICSLYVGWRFLDDPRLQAETWVKENMPVGSTVEKDIYSLTWMYMPEVKADVTVMPFVTGRERLFEVLFLHNEFINGTEEDRLIAEKNIAWFSEAELTARKPDYVVVNSLYYQRFTQPGIRRDLYPSMYNYFSALLSERLPYHIVFDQESQSVPAWVYPNEIDFTHNRVTILVRDESQVNKQHIMKLMNETSNMDPHQSYQAKIPPIPDGTPRPFWSVMIPTYHCARFLRQTLESVLAQDPGPQMMQIEVVDDGSTLDDPATVVAEVGQGRVTFYRQPQNVGHTKNFETCLKRARGKVVHLLHGDDYVRDGFYRKLQHAFESQPEIGAAFCRQIFMDDAGNWEAYSSLEQSESGILNNGLEHLALEQRIMTPSIVVRRDVYERLGGFDSRLICTEDWEMWVRIATQYRIWYETEPLAVYRMHSNSNTGRHVRNGDDIRYTRMAIEIFKSYLPKEKADHLSKKARETYAFSALDTAYAMFLKGDFPAMLAQGREAIYLSRSTKVIQRIGGLVLRAGKVSLQKMIRGEGRA